MPGHSLGLEELIVAGDSTETTKAATLPSSMGEDGLIVDSQSIDVNGTKQRVRSNVQHVICVIYGRSVGNSPRVNLLSHPQPTEEVVGVHGRGETVFCVVC